MAVLDERVCGRRARLIRARTEMVAQKINISDRR